MVEVLVFIFGGRLPIFSKQFDGFDDGQRQKLIANLYFIVFILSEKNMSNSIIIQWNSVLRRNYSSQSMGQVNPFSI